MSACQRQFEVFAAAGRTFTGFVAYRDKWYFKKCAWGPWGGPAPTLIIWECASGYTRSPSRTCVPDARYYAARGQSCAVNFGATPTPGTGRPIDLLTGAKTFDEVDFETADGALRLSRHFHSLRGSGAGTGLITDPLGAGNWSLGFALELHLGDDWDTAGRLGLNTPRGAHYRLIKSGASIVDDLTSSRPLPSTDYLVEYVGTFPGSLSSVRSGKSHWIVRDPESHTWSLETFYNDETEKWDVARPVRVTDNSGVELALAYDAAGVLRSVTDSYNRRISLEWLEVFGKPRAVSVARLPDGARVEYAYEALGVGSTMPDRLIRAELRDAGGNLLDKTTYQYSDARYPYFVTALLDKNGAVRWTVAYDAEARAISSSGPGGAEAYSVSYSADGTTFNRTVTNPLGKTATYNFTRSSLTRFDPVFVGVVGVASPNCPASSSATTYGTDKFAATSSDEEGRVTGFTRDARGRPTSVVEAQGTPAARTTGLTWHPSIHAVTQSTEPGLTTTYAYVAASPAGFPASAYTVTQAFAFAGAGQSYTVPAGATQATVELWGGAGGNGTYSAGAWSGAGGYVRATFAVSAGDTLTLEVGGGGQGGVVSTSGGNGGWPDGGGGARGNRGSGGGGGSSRFYINGALKAVAGGGGGSGGIDGWGLGGAGGPNGQDAAPGFGGGGGGGGTQVAAGVDLSDPTSANKFGRSLLAFPGAQRTGGWGGSAGDTSTATSDDGGGGGGGYWGGGGGGGDGHAGGGGSSWVDPSAFNVDNLGGHRQFPARTPPGLPAIATGVNSTAGGSPTAGGDGYAIVGLR